MQRAEALAVTGERAALSGCAGPRLLYADVEPQDTVGAERVAHRRRGDAAAAEGHHPGASARQ